MRPNWPEAAAQRAEAASQRLASEWGLRQLRLLNNAYCSLVHEVESDEHGPCVLKVPVIGEELTSGFRATLAFDGHGGVPIYKSEEASSATLMPRLLSSGDLMSVSEERARKIFVELVKRSRSVPKFEATPLERWHTEPRPPHYPADRWDRATSIVHELLRTTSSRAYLHGDLHHENALPDAQGQYFAIDPKGIIGDPAYECVAFMRNPLSAMLSEDLLADRIEYFSSALGLDRARIWAWSYADTELANAVSPGPFPESCGRVAPALWSLRSRYN